MLARNRYHPILASIPLLLSSFVSAAFAQSYQIEVQVGYEDTEGKEFDDSLGKADVSESEFAISGKYFFRPVKNLGPVTGKSYLQRVSSIGFNYRDNEETENYPSADGNESEQHWNLILAYYFPDDPLFIILNHNRDKGDIDRSYNVDFDREGKSTVIAIGFFLQKYLSLALIKSTTNYTYNIPNQDREIVLNGLQLQNVVPIDEDYLAFQLSQHEGDLDFNRGPEFDLSISLFSLSYSFSDSFEIEAGYVRTNLELPGADTSESRSLTFKKPITERFRLDLEYTDLSRGNDEGQKLAFDLVAKF